jgi:uncharacterized protein (TIGR03083 family)
LTASLRDHISLERQELADVLSGLSAQRWQESTLCAGWNVRDVVAHVTMPFRYSTARFAAELVKARGRFNVMADRCARRDAASMSAADLVAAVHDNADHPWKPPGGGYESALTHEVIHGLDYTVPLGVDRRVPQDHLRIVLHDADTPKARKFFRVDLTGVQLVADDMDWSRGSGEPIHGAAQHLLLVMCGRRIPAALLRGQPADRFTD